MTKNETLAAKTKKIFKEVIFKYNDDFSNEKFLNLVDAHPSIFNIEHLVELTMAKVGGYKFIDAEHCDFSDGSECKTGGVRPNAEKGPVHRVEISNTISPGGTVKAGDLRTVIYNAVTDSLEYFFIPKDNIFGMSNLHPTTGMGRIFATYNRDKKQIRKLESFRCMDFEKLCTQPITK